MIGEFKVIVQNLRFRKIDPHTQRQPTEYTSGYSFFLKE